MSAGSASHRLLLLLLLLGFSSTSSAEPCGSSVGLTEAIDVLLDVLRQAENTGHSCGRGGGGGGAGGGAGGVGGGGAGGGGAGGGGAGGGAGAGGVGAGGAGGGGAGAGGAGAGGGGAGAGGVGAGGAGGVGAGGGGAGAGGGGAGGGGAGAGGAGAGAGGAGAGGAGAGAGGGVRCQPLFTCPSPLLQLARSVAQAGGGEDCRGDGGSSGAAAAEIRRRHKMLKDALPGMVASERGRPGLLALLLLWLRSAGERTASGVRVGREKVDVVSSLRRAVDTERKWLRRHACPLSSFYELSLSALSLCVSDLPVDPDVASILVDASREAFTRCPGDAHSTMSMCSLALSCVSSRPAARSGLSPKLAGDVEQAARRLLRRLQAAEAAAAAEEEDEDEKNDEKDEKDEKEEEAFERTTSVYGSAVAMQALTAGVRLLGISPPGWDCGASERRLVAAALAGRFGNPAAAAHALLALSGRSFYDAATHTCGDHGDRHGTSHGGHGDHGNHGGRRGGDHGDRHGTSHGGHGDHGNHGGRRGGDHGDRHGTSHGGHGDHGNHGGRRGGDHGNRHGTSHGGHGDHGNHGVGRRGGDGGPLEPHLVRRGSAAVDGDEEAEEAETRNTGEPLARRDAGRHGAVVSDAVSDAVNVEYRVSDAVSGASSASGERPRPSRLLGAASDGGCGGGGRGEIS
ncbi:uncharacterized protein LOC144740998, partial [Lampetra planeri]